ncbi:hypothetical protein CAE01nite_10530 [Cellulomonas aerilata]|uniref:Uncharacterized protein n=1 Tax=Cellulomonas aerilata TaxID=515326 RepID=A0A512DA19_9CELL|nr:hypothetical protein CAE01nite_10530 [Cellulomonas aerilata]
MVVSPVTGDRAADGQLDLPRVPWEGGPAYYARFAGLNERWQDPAFFPVMYWGAYVNETDKAWNNAAKGINVYGEVYAPVPGWDENARAAGIDQIGHVLPDEADMWAGYGHARWTGRWGFQDGICEAPGVGCSPDLFRQLEAERPADGLMRYYNGGKGMMMWMPPEVAATFVDGESWPVGVATTSLYFYSDWNLHGGDPAWPGEATTFLGVPRDQVRRAANYGEAAMTRLRELDARDGERTPLGVLVELGQQSGSVPGDFGHASMTPEQIEGAVWSSLIHEARLVGYFSHAFGTQPTSDALNHPAGDPHYDAVKAKVTQVNARVAALAPVLNTQSYEWDFGPGVSTMLKVHAGSAYVFAQQARAAHTSGTYSFTLPPGVTGTTVEVVGERRTLPVVGGRFSDTFAAEHSTHIYRVHL